MNSTGMFIRTVLISLAIVAQKGWTVSAIENPSATLAAARAYFTEGRSKSEENSQQHSSLRRLKDSATIGEATFAVVPPVFVGDNSTVETTYPGSDQLDFVDTAPSPTSSPSQDELSYGEDEDEEGEPLIFETTLLPSLSPSAAARGNEKGDVKAPVPTPYPTYAEDGDDEIGTGYPTDGGEIYGWEEEGSPWGSTATYPTEPPTPKPTSLYVPKESGDPLLEETVPAEDEVFYHGLGGKVGSYLDGVESPQEMETDKNLQIVAGTLLASFIVAMLISAHLVMQYPDGLCAGFCRLTLKVICCFARTLCLPCRAICCKGSEQAQNRRSHAPMRTPFPTDLELA